MLERLGRVEGRTEWITLFFPSSCKINKNALFVFGFSKISVQRIFRSTIALRKQSVRVTLPRILLLCLAAKKWWSVCDWLFTAPLSTWIMLDIGRFGPNQNAYLMKWGSKLKRIQAYFLGVSWSDWRQKALCHSSCEIFLYLINIHINYSYINTSSNHGVFPVLISRSYWWSKRRSSNAGSNRKGEPWLQSRPLSFLYSCIWKPCQFISFEPNFLEDVALQLWG